jgi:phage repressor protein C with HTH and peptisase S24 domain
MTYTVRQLAVILGVTERAVQKRAKNEGWQPLARRGQGRTQEFQLSALPRDIRIEISKAKEPRQAPGEFVTILEIAAAMGVTRQAAHRRALDESWARDPLETKPMRYLVDALPEDVRAVIMDPDSLGTGYVALKKLARKKRHVEKNRRTTLGNEEFRLLLGRIKQALGVRSDTSVARALGLSQSTMSSAKKKKQIPSSWIIQIAKEKGVSLDWLVYGAAPTVTDDFGRPDAPKHVLYLSIHEVVSTPNGARLDVNTSVQPIPFPDGYFEKRDVATLAAIESVGDSMSPDVLHGDVVVVDTQDTALLPGGMFAVDVNGMVYLKRVNTTPGRLVLSCANPAYSDIAVPIVEGKPEGIVILGRVVWLGRKISN